MPETVPMSHPATAVKNSDGTYSVRIQHTVDGLVTTVDFTNVLFAEVLAKSYAATLNGQAVVEAKIGQLASDLGPAVADAKADVARVVAAAEAEAQKLITAARTEAGAIKADAVKLVDSAKTESATLAAEGTKLYEAAKTEAEKLLSEARAEASKILSAVEAKVRPAPAASAATEAPKPPVPTGPTREEIIAALNCLGTTTRANDLGAVADTMLDLMTMGRTGSPVVEEE